jgi:hypothetical protein
MKFSQKFTLIATASLLCASASAQFNDRYEPRRSPTYNSGGQGNSITPYSTGVGGYNVEAGIGYSKLSSDNQTTSSGWIVGGEYYFRPISPSSAQPFGELGFLQRASSLGLSYQKISLESQSLAANTIGIPAIGGTAYLDNWRLNARYQTWSGDFGSKSGGSAVNIDSKLTDLGVGYFVERNTLLSFQNTSNKSNYSGSSTPSSRTSTTNSIAFKGVSNSVVSQVAYAQIKSESDSTQTQNNSAFSGYLRYYPQNNYYFEGNVEFNRGDDALTAGRTLGLGLGWAFAPRWNTVIGYSKFDVTESVQMTSSSSAFLVVNHRF